MENASKALIIAGAILLSILIIALGIYVFNMAKGATNTNSLDELEISQFNQLFTTYDGKLMGNNVTSLMDKLVSNASTNKDSDDSLPDLIYIETRTGTSALTTANGATGVKVTGATAIPGNDPVLQKITDAGFTGTPTFQIASDSAATNVAGFSAFRSKLSPRHYYQVGHIVDDDTGLVSHIIVKY